MLRSIRVLDLLDGKLSERTGATGTLDVPADLDRKHGLVSVDRRAHGSYQTAEGSQRTYSAFVRPLSWRATGEVFLIAESRGAKDDDCTYRLASIPKE